MFSNDIKILILKMLFFWFLLPYFIPNYYAQTIPTKLDTVKLQLDFYHKFQFAGYYMASKKGFYKDVGLFVDILELNNLDINICRTVINRTSEYGVIGSSIVEQRLAGSKVVLLKAIYQHSPYVILTLKKNNIRTPSDLVGKKLMVSSGATPPLPVYNMFKSEGISIDKITFVKHTFNYDDLLNGKVDAITGYATTQPFYLKLRGYEPYCISPIDYGVDLYRGVLFTSEEEIRKYPKRTDAFIEASIKGWKYAYNNVEETIDFILSLPSKRKNKMTREILKYEAEISRKYVLPDIIEIGHINKERIRKIEKMYKEYHSYNTNIDMSKFIYQGSSNYYKVDIQKIFLIVVISIVLFVFMLIIIGKRLKKKTVALEEKVIENKLTKGVLDKEKITRMAIVNAIPDIMLITSRDGIILEANIPIENDLSLIKGEIVGKHIAYVLPDETIPVAIKKTFMTKKLQVVEYEKFLNSSKKFFEVRVILVDEDEVLLLLRDITIVKSKTEELIISEEKFSKIFYNNPDPMLLTDATTHIIVDCNQKFLDVPGFSRNEIIGKTPIELNLWANEKDRQKFIKEISEKGIISGSYYNFRRKNGSIVNCLVFVEVVSIHNKKMLLGIYRDVTDIIQKEEQLKETRINFSKMFKLAPITIVISSLVDGKIFDINSKAEEFMHMKAEDVIGKTFIEIGFWKSKVEREKYVSKLLDNNNFIKDMEVKFQSEGGKVVFVSLSSEVIEINSEKYIITCLVDLTEMKQNEIVLQKTLDTIKDLKQKLQKENILLKEEINTNYKLDNIVTKSSAVKKELRKIQQVAPTKATVLVLGETGTGKELFARTIHSLSKRAEEPLVKVNCAALPSNLIESELFGHEEGAFTGAVKQHIGRFELADKATIFLDEIGELPIDVQAKLLRVLQEGEFERVGSSKTISVDVRIIAASNRDLQKMIKLGTFREDLFYRLNVFPINTIPLRNRPEDIEVLVNNFVKQLSTRIGKKITSIDKISFNSLLKYSFPGNVRELQNIIERAIIEANTSVLEITTPFMSKQSHVVKSSAIERDEIVLALSECDWKIEGKNGAAKQLGVPASTLRDKIKKYNLKRP